MLGAVKMKEAQSNDAAMVLNTTDQTASSTKHDVAGAHFAFDHHLRHRLNAPDGRNLSAINIPQGQMKKQILNAIQAQLL